MPTLTHTHVIDRPIADVFAVVSDWTTLPIWDPAVSSVRQITDGEPGLGTRYEFRFRVLGPKVMTTTALEQDRLIEVSSTSHLYEAGHRFTLATEGQATWVSHTLVLNPRGPLRVLSPPTALIARTILNRTCAQLQAHCERR